MTKNWRKESNIRNSGCACFSNTLYRYMKQLIRFFFFLSFSYLKFETMTFFFAVYNTVLQCCLMWLRAFFPHCYQICPSTYVDALLQSDYNLPYMSPPLSIFTLFFFWRVNQFVLIWTFHQCVSISQQKWWKSKKKKKKREREKKNAVVPRPFFTVWCAWDPWSWIDWPRAEAVEFCEDVITLQLRESSYFLMCGGSLSCW